MKTEKKKSQFRPKAILAKLKPIAKHHYFIAIVLLFSGLAYEVYTVNETLNTPKDNDYEVTKLQQTIGSKFNKTAKDTIARIKALQKSSDPSQEAEPFPDGRINPFAE